MTYFLSFIRSATANPDADVYLMFALSVFVLVLSLLVLLRAIFNFESKAAIKAQKRGRRQQIIAAYEQCLMRTWRQ